MCAGQSPCLSFAPYGTRMADLFCDSDLVICSASSVCIEALACGAKVAAGWLCRQSKGVFMICFSFNGGSIGLGM